MPLLYSLAATAAPWLAPDPRRLRLADPALGAYAVLNLIGLTGGGMSGLAATGALPREAGPLVRRLKDEGVSRGYAG